MFIMTKDGWRELRHKDIQPLLKTVAVEEDAMRDAARAGKPIEGVRWSGPHQKFVKEVVMKSHREEHWDSAKLGAGVDAYLAWLIRQNEEARESRRHYASTGTFRKSAFYQKLRKVEALRDGAKTPGERAAAEAAIERIKNA